MGRACLEQTNGEATPDWAARFRALADLDGDAWDRRHDALENEWKAAYSVAFIEIAVARGWTRENAQTWPEHIRDEAWFGKHAHGECPRASADYDVRMCELETE